MDVLALGPALQWPRTWAKQKLMLEAQHDRIESTLAKLIELYEESFGETSKELTVSFDGSCRRLLWDFKLHMRLEERWIKRQGFLCIGHREDHVKAMNEAISGYQRSLGSQCRRLQWLQNLKAWFEDHRAGPDLYAYSLTSAQP